MAEFSKQTKDFIFVLVPYPVSVEVAIHTILYVRQIYPPDLFVRRRKYDMPVFQSRHPALNEYISGAVRAIADELVSVSHQLKFRR